MDTSFVKTPEVQALLDKAAGLGQPGGDARLKAIFRDIIEASAEIIVRYDVGEDEFWGAVNFLQKGAGEYGLLVPGSGLEHFLDLFMDAKDAEAGLTGGTPRTIEGPLAVSPRLRFLPMSKRPWRGATCSPRAATRARAGGARRESRTHS